MSSPTKAIEKLDSITFDELLAGQHPFENGNSLFDLTGTRLITSAAITQLAAACYAANLAGEKPKVLVDDSGVRSYLVRSGFVALVEPIAQIEPGFRSSMFYGMEGLRGSNPMLIELNEN